MLEVNHFRIEAIPDIHVNISKIDFYLLLNYFLVWAHFLLFVTWRIGS